MCYDINPDQSNLDLARTDLRALMVVLWCVLGGVCGGVERVGCFLL